MTKARASVTQQSTFGGRRAGLPIQYVLQAPNIEKLTRNNSEIYGSGSG